MNKIIQCPKELIENKTIIFDLLLTSLCNYKCSYCISKNEHNNILYFGYRKNYDTFFYNIKKVFNDKSIKLYISGVGEPTLNPNFFYILNNLLKCKQIKKIHLLTNLSMPISFWNKLINVVKKYDVYFRIRASLHIEKNQTETDIDTFFEKILYLQSNNIDVFVKTILDHHTYSLILKNISYLNKYNKLLNKNIDIIKSYLVLNKNTLNTKYKEIYEKINDIELIEKNKNNNISFKNFYCYGGLKWFRINIDGNVYNTSDKFSCLTHQCLGNIFIKDNIFLPTHPMICKNDKCLDNCSYQDIPKSNYLIEEYL